MGWLKKAFGNADIKIGDVNFSQGQRLWRNIRKTLHVYRHRNDYEDLSRGLSRRHLVGNTGFSRYVTPLGVRGGSTSARQVVGNTNFRRFSYG